ncbi:cysteine desulfurase family protein [Sedimentibacter sp.]|uniref:cysteine desulfurase family protein n=1 Tax=Sedimentibacter sp. TaxID=1960295 RepID=UPI00289FC12C|nr:cysteine desulfurase family protein [Sedimentibacter sp.]
MIYLDYAANTPADEQVINIFSQVSRDFIANPNSSHGLGIMAAERLKEAAEKIARLFNVQENEIIYTSGASESNNLAIKGIAGQYKKYGKHIITTYLEHSSVNGAVEYLKNNGYEVDYVDIDSDGLVDLQSLKELIRKDTILVSICCVDGEVGIKQPINEIAALIAEYPNCYFHTDATQAVGKIPVSFENVDLVTFAPHKFYGLNGCGVLIKKENVLLEPLIHGGISTTAFRSGTPSLNMIAAAEKALSLAYEELEDRYNYVRNINSKVRNELKKYKEVRINSTEYSVPYILNISMNKVNTEQFKAALEEHDIFVSTKSACCAPNTASRPVYALTKDRKRALSTLRISFSHLTSENDIDVFLEKFDECYTKFVK